MNALTNVKFIYYNNQNDREVIILQNRRLIKEAKFIHAIIGVVIMIFFRFLPNFPYITDIGMEVFGIFLGTIYLWTTVETLWSSLLSIFLLGISNYSSMDNVLGDFLGSPIIIIVLFMFILSGAMEHYGITDHIAYYCLTRKSTYGRPWLLVFIIGIACMLVGGFSSPFTSIMIFWSIMDSVFKQLSFDKKDVFPQLIRILIVISSVLGFPIAPFMQNSLVLIRNLETLSSDLPKGPITIADAGYFTFTLMISFILWSATVLFSKYILRPDTLKLMNLNEDIIINNKPVPMDIRQKSISIGFFVMILLMLIPSIFPTLPGMTLLKSWNAGFPLAITAILCLINLGDGKPIINLNTVACRHFNWTSFFIVGAAVYLGNVITDDSTGICTFINWLLAPLLSGMSPAIFTMFILLMAAILSNLGNSLVVGLILQTIILAYYVTNPTLDIIVVNTLIIYFTLGTAIILPSASPFAAMMHGNNQISRSLIYKVAPLFVLIQYVIIIVIGIPLATLIFQWF